MNPYPGVFNTRTPKTLFLQMRFFHRLRFKNPVLKLHLTSFNLIWRCKCHALHYSFTPIGWFFSRVSTQVNLKVKSKWHDSNKGQNSKNFSRKIHKISMTSRDFYKVVSCNGASVFDFYSSHYQTIVILTLKNWFNSKQTWHFKT